MFLFQWSNLRRRSLHVNALQGAVATPKPILSSEMSFHVTRDFLMLGQVWAELSAHCYLGLFVRFTKMKKFTSPLFPFFEGVGGSSLSQNNTPYRIYQKVVLVL